MPSRADSVGAVILPKAHSEEGCLESLKLQSLVVVVTRVFLLWIRVCSRDCRERRRSERRRKEGGREGGERRGEEPSHFLHQFHASFPMLPQATTAATRADDAFLHTTFYREKKMPVAPLARSGDCANVVTGDSRGNPGRQTTISQTKSSHG